MSALSGDYKSIFIQSPLIPEREYLFTRNRLEKIANIFGISEEKIRKLNNDWALQNKCFKKIVHACELGHWEKINSVIELILGIRDQKGQTLYEVLTSIEEAPPNFCMHPPENLVFQGGGPKGLAYIGAIEVLEERNILPNVKRIAGTSAGAITATLIAVGCSSKEISKFLKEKSLTEVLLDVSISKSGFFAGGEFLNWINTIIEQKTGIKNCTFGQLKNEIKKGRNFNIYISLQ